MACTAMGSSAQASDAPPATDLEVRLVVRQPLVLLEHVWQNGPGEVSLSGRLLITVRNTSSAPIALRELDAHGLVFTHRGTGRLWPVVHPCACVRDLTEGPKAGVTLQPATETTLVLEDWGCGGGAWKTPPPGDYRVDYRVLPMPATPTRRARTDRSPPQLVEQCRREMATDAFWATATRSSSLDVKLRKPKRTWVR